MSEFRSFSMKERVEIPISVLVAIGGMLLITAGVVVRLILMTATSSVEASAAPRMFVTIVGSVVLGFLPALSAWAVSRAWRSASVLVTIVAAFAVFYSLGYRDLLAVSCAVAGIASVVAINRPSARKYRLDRRAKQQ